MTTTMQSSSNKMGYSLFRWIWAFVCLGLYALIRFPNYPRSTYYLIDFCSYTVLAGALMAMLVNQEKINYRTWNQGIAIQLLHLPIADKILIALIIIISYVIFPFEDLSRFSFNNYFIYSALLATAALLGIRKCFYVLFFAKKPFHRISTYILLNMILACLIVFRLFS